jgi:uncharacterized protein YhfF
MNAHEMWNQFTQDPKLSYEAWAFGMAPDHLAQLVVCGIKHATASLHGLYLSQGEPVPQKNQYSIILDSSGDAVCIIMNTKVTILPYQDVTEEMAQIEGEGDQSLSYWRSVHFDFFTHEASSIGLVFNEQMLVVFEEFEVVYLPSF